MSRTEQKNQTRQRILEAAGRSFRKGGFGGVGVDGLSKEAGVTSGAFYKHFSSKSDAFREAVIVGVSDVLNGIRHCQTSYGAQWWHEFVRFYLGEKRKCNLGESCGLQSLSAEVARADATAREAFTAELNKVASAIVDTPGLDAPTTVNDARAALATLIGAVTLARAVDDPALAKSIAASAERQLISQKRSKVVASRGAKR